MFINYITIYVNMLKKNMNMFFLNAFKATSPQSCAHMSQCSLLSPIYLRLVGSDLYSMGPNAIG